MSRRTSSGHEPDAFNRRDLDAYLALRPRSGVHAAHTELEGGSLTTAMTARDGESLDVFPDFRSRSRRSRSWEDDRARPFEAGGKRRAHRGTCLARVTVRHARSTGRATAEAKPKPSKPPGCGSRRCRRRTSRSSTALRSGWPARCELRSSLAGPADAGKEQRREREPRRQRQAAERQREAGAPERGAIPVHHFKRRTGRSRLDTKSGEPVEPADHRAQSPVAASGRVDADHPIPGGRHRPHHQHGGAQSEKTCTDADSSMAT